MDLSTDKIIVLDLDEERPGKESFTASKLMVEVCFFFQKFLTIIVLGGFIC